MNWKKAIPSIVVAGAIALTSFSGTLVSFASSGTKTPAQGFAVDTTNPSKWAKSEGFAAGFGSIESKNGALEFTRASGGGDEGGSLANFDYLDVTRKNPITLNVNEISHLLTDFTIDNGWNIKLQLRIKNSAEKDYKAEDELSLDLNSLLHFWRTGGAGVGDYSAQIWGSKEESKHFSYNAPIPLSEMISIAKAMAKDGNATNFSVGEDGLVQLVQVRIGIDWVDPGKGMVLRKLELGKADPSIQLSMSTADQWYVWPDHAACAEVSSANNELSFFRKADCSGHGAADQIWFENKYFSRKYPKFVDLDTVSKLDISMIAANGWNVTMNIRVGTNLNKDWVDQNELHLDLNKYINSKRGNGFTYGLYGDREPDKQFVLDETVDLKDWIKVAMENRAANSGKDFALPADGVIQIIELRVTPNYFPIGEGIVLKELSFNTVKSNDNTVTSAAIGNVNGKISGSNISFAIPSSGATDGKMFAPTFVIPEGAVISPASGTKLDFSAPQEYTVTSEFGTTQTFTVSVSIVNSDASISAAVVTNGDETITGKIDGNAISFAVKSGFNLAAVEPSFTISGGASISPTGVQDFSKGPIKYTVTPQDGSAPTEYTVSIAILSNACSITKATINGVEGKIDGTNISFTLPVGTDAAKLRPVFVLSQNATVSPSGEADFTNPVTYTVTAEDGTTKAYTLKVAVSAASTYYNVDLSTEWKHTEGPIEFASTAYDESKKALVIDANKSGEWANVDNVGFPAPYKIDINTATHFHFDITAGNGWGIKLLVKANGQDALIDANKFISVRDGLGDGIYYAGTYKDSLNIKDMINSANPNFIIPENGVVEIHLVRVWVGYHSETPVTEKDRDAGIEIRYLALDNATASNTVGEGSAVKPVGPAEYYESNLKGEWKDTGEGDISMGDISYNEDQKALIGFTAKGGTWANVDYQFAYGEKAVIDTTKATHFHFDFTTGNGFDVNILLLDKDGDTLFLSLNEYISYITGKTPGLYYKGTYKDSVDLKQWISYIASLEKNKDNKFNIPDDGIIQVMQIRFHVSYLDADAQAFEIRTLSFDNEGASNISFEPVTYSNAAASAYHANLKGVWKHVEGPIEFSSIGYDNSKGGLSAVASKAGTWANIDYQFGYKEKIILDTNKSTHVHFDITAGNGWNLMFLVKDDNGNALPVSVNNFKSELDGHGYTNHYYGGTYKEKFDIRKMIEKTIQCTPDTKFKMPANGVIEIAQLRMWVGYHGDKDASVVLRKFNFNNQDESNIPNAPTGESSNLVYAALFAAIACGFVLLTIGKKELIRRNKITCILK